MPQLELFSEYIKRNQLNAQLTHVENVHTTILQLIDEQMAGLHADQQLLGAFSVELLAELSRKAREMHRQYELTPPPDRVLTGRSKSDVTKAFGDILTVYYNKARAAAVAARGVQIQQYYGGVDRKIAHGRTINIKIAEEAWDVMANRGNREQILNILAQDPIDIRVAGNFMGNRCIKPEPYGWIFSTSVGLRLTDATTSTAAFPPPSLNFNTTRQAMH